MDDLDDLLDDLNDVPKTKKSNMYRPPVKSTKLTSKKQNDSFDDLDGMLDDVLGKDKPKNTAYKSSAVKTSSKPSYSDAWGGEESKADDGWGDSSGSSSLKTIKKKVSYTPKVPKKGDKCYPVVLAGSNIPSGYCANSMYLAVCNKLM